MACSWCQCEEHVLRCDNEIAPGVRCPCNRVPVPGIWHPDDEETQ